MNKECLDSLRFNNSRYDKISREHKGSTGSGPIMSIGIGPRQTPPDFYMSKENLAVVRALLRNISIRISWNGSQLQIQLLWPGSFTVSERGSFREVISACFGRFFTIFCNMTKPSFTITFRLSIVFRIAVGFTLIGLTHH